MYEVLRKEDDPLLTSSVNTRISKSFLALLQKIFDPLLTQNRIGTGRSGRK